MALPKSGLITAAMINVELKRAASAAFSLGGAAERKLANVLTGPISFADFYGKSSIIKNIVLSTSLTGTAGNISRFTIKTVNNNGFTSDPTDYPVTGLEMLANRSGFRRAAFYLELTFSDTKELDRLYNAWQANKVDVILTSSAGITYAINLANCSSVKTPSAKTIRFRAQSASSRGAARFFYNTVQSTYDMDVKIDYK